MDAYYGGHAVKEVYSLNYLTIRMTGSPAVCNEFVDTLTPLPGFHIQSYGRTVTKQLE
jgi:hypothetical protein